MFNLAFANNTILPCFFLFFLIIELYHIRSAVISQTFNPTAELVIPIGIPTKDAKAKIEIHSETLESKMKC